MRSLPRSRFWLACWWLVWAAILGRMLWLHRFTGDFANHAHGFSKLVYFVILVPMLSSLALRLFLLPRMRSVFASFGMFAGGMILASMSALPGTFVEIPYREATFWLCACAIVLHAPIGRRGNA